MTNPLSVRDSTSTALVSIDASTGISPDEALLAATREAQEIGTAVISTQQALAQATRRIAALNQRVVDLTKLRMTFQGAEKMSAARLDQSEPKLDGRTPREVMESVGVRVNDDPVVVRFVQGFGQEAPYGTDLVPYGGVPSGAPERDVTVQAREETPLLVDGGKVIERTYTRPRLEIEYRELDRAMDELRAAINRETSTNDMRMIRLQGFVQSRTENVKTLTTMLEKMNDTFDHALRA